MFTGFEASEGYFGGFGRGYVLSIDFTITFLVKNLVCQGCWLTRLMCTPLDWQILDAGKKIYFKLNALEDVSLVVQACASFGMMNRFKEFQSSMINIGRIESCAAKSGVLIRI